MGEYPRELVLDEDTENRLISYLDEIISNSQTERSSFIDNIVSWQKDYWAEPSNTAATFPFVGAATIIIPLAAITIEATHARTMTTLFALSQFVSLKSLSTDYADTVRPLEKFLDHELLHNVKIYNPLNDAVLELIKYGTGVVKCGFEKITKSAMRPKENSNDEEEFSVTIKNGACVNAIPLSRFMMPFEYQDPQDASWCGEEHESTMYEVRLLENSGFFGREDVTEDLIGHFTLISQNAATQNQQELEDRKPVAPNQITWYEIWTAFDVVQKSSLVDEFGSRLANTLPGGEAREIVVYYHRDSRTIMSCRYNWLSDLRRPYYKGVYFPVEHRWAGIGACKQLDQFQKEITTQHRQRLDNATIANVRMIKVSKMSDYGPNEPIFPGKMWFLDNMADVETFQLGEIYPSAFSNEHQTLAYAQQRSGVNELNLGMPQVGTPGTATAELSRVQEGNKKFDYVYGHVRRMASDVVMDVAAQIQQFGPKSLAYYDNVADGDLVRKFLELPPTLIREGILVSIAVAGQQENTLLDRQNYQQIATIIQQYYQAMVDLAEKAGDQAKLQAIVQHGMTAATEAMKQIMESFDMKNIDRLIIPESVINAPTQPSPPPTTGGGNPATQPPPGMGQPQIAP